MSATRDARDPRRAARSRCRAAGGARFRHRGAREGDRPGGAALGDAGRRWSSRSSTTISSRCSAAATAPPRGQRGDGSTSTRPPPVGIMLVGLQGSGKTTTAAKIALRLKNRERKKVLMASLDVQRPAAQEQLAQLGRQIGVATLPIVPGQRPVEITRRALEIGRREGYDVVMLDTAGRLHVNEELMLEVAAVREAANAAPDPARRRRDDRPGRGQCRQGVWRARRHHRHRADPRRWRRARRRRAVDARDHRQADRAASAPARRSTRSNRSTRTASPAASSAWAMSSASSRRPPRPPTRTRPRSSPRKMQKGEFDLDDLAGAVPPDPPHGRDERHARHAAGDRQDQEADGRRQYRRDASSSARRRSSAR